MADGQGASPQRITEILQGFMASAALKTALDLEVFTHIAHGSDTADTLASVKHVTVRAIRILCDALVAFGVLDKLDGRYMLPEASRKLLVKGSPAYVGATAGLLVNDEMWRESGRLTEIVKAGHCLIEHSADAMDNPFWQEFARRSKQMAAMAAPAVVDAIADLFPGGSPRRILDVAAGSGMYGFAALKRFPEAHLESVDWPAVLNLAEATAAQMGIAGRVEYRGGDIFTMDLGTGYDLVLAINIYHHFSPAQCTELSRRLYEASAPGGVLMVVDSIPDEKREQERFALAFALTMLIWTHEGDTYTLSEYERMLKPAGWRDIALRPIAGPRPTQAIVARR